MAEKKPASSKRMRIARAQQFTMLEVLGASLVLGACVVVCTFLIKYIKFNTQIIAAKNDAIIEYDKTMRNVGVCIDEDKNGRLSDKEIEKCKPNEVSLTRVNGSLRANVLATMAQNKDLESVARQRNENCYDGLGVKLDFQKLYELSSDENERRNYLQMSKICSALRVIPDALPAQKNTEALMASLNQIFILTGKEPERLMPRDDLVVNDIAGVDVIPVTLRVEGVAPEVMAVLNKIERSVREFDVTVATAEWTNLGISLQAAAHAYYLAEDAEVEEKVTLYATPKARTTKKSSQSGGN